MYLCPQCGGVVGQMVKVLGSCLSCKTSFTTFSYKEWNKARDDTAGKASLCESSYASGYGNWHLRLMTEQGKKLGGGIDTGGLCGNPKKGWGWDLEAGITEHHLEKNTCKKCLAIYREGAHGVHHDVDSKQ